jgi:hypothetical protein
MAMKITKEQMKAAYEVGKRVYEKALTRADGIDELHRRFALNRGSAGDTINNICYMLKGESYARTNNAFATDHFLEMIHRDYGLPGLIKGISAVDQHLKYYEALGQGKLLAIHEIVQKYHDIADAGPQELFARQEQILQDWGEFEPNNVADARDWTISAIVRRRGQPAFRNLLLRLYQTRCAISDCPVEAALEAAHILPYKGPKTNHASNGLLLRADLHTLFDLGFLAIDTRTMAVLISPELKGTCYQEYAGRKLRLPNNRAGRPNCEALDNHRKTRGKSCMAV